MGTGFNVDEQKKVFSRQEISKTVGGFLQDLKVGSKLIKKKKKHFLDRSRLTLLCVLWLLVYKEGKPVLSKTKQNKNKKGNFLVLALTEIYLLEKNLR